MRAIYGRIFSRLCCFVGIFLIVKKKEKRKRKFVRSIIVSKMSGLQGKYDTIHYFRHSSTGAIRCRHFGVNQQIYGSSRVPPFLCWIVATLSLRSLATLLPSLSALFEIYCAHLSRRETTKSDREILYPISTTSILILIRFKFLNNNQPQSKL